MFRDPPQNEKEQLLKDIGQFIELQAESLATGQLEADENPKDIKAQIDALSKLYRLLKNPDTKKPPYFSQAELNMLNNDKDEPLYKMVREFADTAKKFLPNHDFGNSHKGPSKQT